MSKERQTGFNNVSMPALVRAILLVCVRTCHMMRDVKLGEERIELLILASPIRLYGKNLVIELLFNEGLKILEFLKYFRLKLD
jgi:hypothetical protein